MPESNSLQIPPSIIIAKTYDARGNGDGMTVPTLTGDHENRVTDYTALVCSSPCYCLQGNGIDRADTAGCNGRGWTEGVSYTLNTIDRPAVVFQTYQERSGPLMANSHPGSYTGQDAFNDMLGLVSIAETSPNLLTSILHFRRNRTEDNH